MKKHILSLSDLTGLKCTDCTFTSCSRDADTAEFSFLLDGFNADIPWSFGDAVQIEDNGRTVFYGYVTEEPVLSFPAGGRAVSIKLGNIVALLDAVPYTESQSFKGVLKNEERIADAREIISTLYEMGAFVPGGDRAEETAAIDFDASIVCPAGSGSQSCWSLISSCLHWVPDVVTWFDHGQKTLHFRKAADGGNIYIDLVSGTVTRGQELLFTFAGADSISFRPRHDLCPPAVGLNWTQFNVSKTFPEGASLAQPWAFVYQVPQISGGGLSEEEKKPVQEAAAEKMELLGIKVLDGWQLNGNMRTIFPTPDENKKFWSHFASCEVLKKTDADCLQFGTPMFYPVPVEDAYPQVDELEEVTLPANYKMFEPGDSIFVLAKGSFPASANERENLPLLKFCKGKLKQYVWLRKDYIGEATREEFDSFFKGADKFEPASGAEPVKSRYALLEMDAVFVNRGHKRFFTGTNKLDEKDPDFEEENAGDGDSVIRTQRLVAVAEDYYNATRTLFYDGAISLRGVSGFDSALLSGANLCIINGRKEWETMNTPIVQAVWNPFQQTLELSTGSPEILTFDERLQRQQIGRQNAAGAGTSFAKTDPVKDEGDEEETDSSFSMVSPSISMNVGITASGKFLNPFQIFQNGDKWFINEGVYPSPTGMINFPTTDITELKAKFSKVTIVPEFSFTEKTWELKIKGFN